MCNVVLAKLYNGIQTGGVDTSLRQAWEIDDRRQAERISGEKTATYVSFFIAFRPTSNGWSRRIATCSTGTNRRALPSGTLGGIGSNGRMEQWRVAVGSQQCKVPSVERI